MLIKAGKFNGKDKYIDPLKVLTVEISDNLNIVVILATEGVRELVSINGADSIIETNDIVSTLIVRINNELLKEHERS